MVICIPSFMIIPVNIQDMADVLSIYKKQAIEWQLQVSTDFPLHYIRQQNALNQEFLVCIKIPWPLLRLWNQLMAESPSHCDVNYIDFVNSTVMDGWFALNRTCQRIDKLIRKHANYAKLDYKRLSGRKRKELDSKLYKLSVRRGEMESVQTVNTKIQEHRKELEEWKTKYSDLAEESKTLYEDMVKEVKNLEEEITDLNETNKALREYVEVLERKESLQCQGKSINNLGNKRTKAQIASKQSAACIVVLQELWAGSYQHRISG